MPGLKSKKEKKEGKNVLRRMEGAVLFLPDRRMLKKVFCMPGRQYPWMQRTDVYIKLAKG